MSNPEKTETKYARKGGEVLEALSATKAHPSAETLYQALREVYPNLSRTTVYTHLNRLRKQGSVTTVGVVDGCERYDANTSPHPHFFCDRCGAVIDVDGLPSLGLLEREAETRNHFRVLGHELSFHGLCEVCAASDEKRSENQNNI